MREKTVETFFTEEEKDMMTQAIKRAEKNSSGEVRIHIESKCRGSELARAAEVFKLLGMHKTKLRNGVLVYLAFQNRKFAIIGDAGINEVVPKDFWEESKEMMTNRFKNGEFGKGIAEAIDKVGEKLAEYFPYQSDDVNELPDDISFGA